MEQRAGAVAEVTAKAAESALVAGAAGPMRGWAPTFYGARSVLVTGHTGFKGAWLSAWLVRLGARVAGLSLPPEDPSLFRIADLGGGGGGGGVASTFGDLRDPRAALSACEAHQPEIVFHLAAQTLVRRSYREPVETFATNVMGTAHVLEAARRTPSVRAVVVVTSDKCYENDGHGVAFREVDPMGGHDPYSASKAAAELVTAAVRRSFCSEPGARLAIASARAGNVLGGGDFAEDRLVPDIVRGARSGEPAVVRNPGATRPFQHVLDPLAGYLVLGRALIEEPRAAASAWNFGPEGEPAPVGHVARRFVELLGQGSLAIAAERSGPHEAQTLRIDTSKARARLGFRNRLDLDETLALTAAWYGAWMARPASAAAELAAQIERYMDRGEAPLASGAGAPPAAEPRVRVHGGMGS